MAAQLLFSEKRDETNQDNTYIYEYTHILPGEDGGQFGAFHSSEISYFLNYFSDVRADYWTEDDFELGKTASSYLVNFASTGNPNGDGLPEWKPTDSSNRYLVIDTETVGSELSEEKMDFWRKVL